MRISFCSIIFLFSFAAFAQEIEEVEKSQEDIEEALFCSYETSGDSCKFMGNEKAAKSFYEQALAIKKVCRVQQKLNEINKVAVKTCPDLKTYSVMAQLADAYEETDERKSDSLRKLEEEIGSEVFYGVLLEGRFYKPRSRPSKAEVRIIQDSIEKMMNEALRQMSEEMLKATDGSENSITDTAAVNFQFDEMSGDAETLGDESFKEGNYELARFYFEEALKQKPKDKVLKKKIAECDKQVRKKKGK